VLAPVLRQLLTWSGVAPDPRPERPSFRATSSLWRWVVGLKWRPSAKVTIQRGTARSAARRETGALLRDGRAAAGRM